MGGRLHGPGLRRWIVYLFFAAGLACIYRSLSPLRVAGMGYTAEEMKAGMQLLGGSKVDMPRNGIVPVLVDLPFLAAAKLRRAEPPAIAQDVSLSRQPCWITAGIATLILVWVHRATGSLGYGVLIAAISAFCTMFWPYAYIGLETKQSFFLLAAAFIVLQGARRIAWIRVFAFAILLAFGISAKSTGAFLLPTAAYLVLEYVLVFRAAHRTGELPRTGLMLRAALIAIVPLGVFLSNSWARSLFWAQYGGSAAFIRPWMVEDPISPFLNVAAFFGSPNKGLWVFSPLCLLGCVALARAWRSERRLAVFTLLTLGGLAGGFALLRNWSDETWGPRYLHTAIAPLMIVFAVVWRRERNVGRAVVGAAAVLGFAAALIGVMFPYTSLALAVNETGQDTLQAYQGDVELNHLRFNARLWGLWAKLSDDGKWGSGRQWFFDKPADACVVKAVDLHKYTVPQPVMFRDDTPDSDRSYLRRLMAAGLVLLGVGAYFAWRRMGSS